MWNRLGALLIALGLALPAPADNVLDHLHDGAPTATAPAPARRPVPVRRPPPPYLWPDDSSRPGYPDYHPRRPLIINTAPATPPLDTSTLTDDWTGCRTAKLAAMRERDNGDVDRANALDEWLWKNCRSFSIELRQLEQNGM